MTSPSLYHPTYLRPPNASPKLTSRIVRLSPTAQGLERAISELISEDIDLLDAQHNSCQIEQKDKKIKTNLSMTNGRMDDNMKANNVKEKSDSHNKHGRYSTCNSARDCSHLEGVGLLDETLKNSLLKCYEQSCCDAIWADSPHQSVMKNGMRKTADNVGSVSNLKRKENTTLPPAALLRGHLISYNRIGNKWKIVCSNAELISKIEFDAVPKKFNCQSLCDSGYTMQENDRKRKRQLENDVSTSVKLDGQVLILAYDDI